MTDPCCLRISLSITGFIHLLPFPELHLDCNEKMSSVNSILELFRSSFCVPNNFFSKLQS